MAYKGINMRETAAFVTDAAGETYCLGEAYPTTRNGITFGWPSSELANSRDRTVTDRRLSGVTYSPNNVTKDFRIDVLTGPATIRLALGDYGSGSNYTSYVRLYDGATLFATIPPIDVIQTKFVDAAGNEWIDADWPTSNVAVTHTFTTTQFIIRLGDGSSAGFSRLAHVSVDIAPPGTTINGIVGNAVAAGSTATITGSGVTTISCAVGNAAANGSTANIARNVTINCVTGNAVADGTSTGTLITEPLINNTESILANQAVVWSWFPGGRIGSLDLVTAIDGTGTTASDGRLTVTGLSPGAGILMVAVLNTNATDDDVYYQAGAVA